MYPKDNLISSGLSAVALGKRKYHRNWMCLGDEKNPPEGIMTQDEKRIDLGKRLDWYHKEHGEVKGVSATKLARMFPEKGLDPSCLTKVSLFQCSKNYPRGRFHYHHCENKRRRRSCRRVWVFCSWVRL